MDNASINLLRQLASGIRPAALGENGGTPAGGAAANIEAGQFAELLKQAQSGELASSRPVTIENDCGVKLSDDQLAKVSLAADKAEVAGIRSAVVFIDGQALKLDVANRTVTGPADLSSGVLSGIDGVINLSPALFAKSNAATIVPLPSQTTPGLSLASLLADRETSAAAA